MTIQVMMFGGTNPITYTGRQISLYSGTDSYFADGVGFDSSGNVYGAMLNINNNGSNVISKYTNGGLQWVVNATLASGVSSSTVSQGYKNFVVDSSGNSYSTWTVNTGSAGIGYILKVNSSGTVQWQRKLTNAANSVGVYCVGLDSTAANICVAGAAQVGSNSGAFVAKYDSAGAIAWQRYLNAGGNSIYIGSTGFDSAGNIYAVGYANPGGGTIYGFIVKYNSTGTLQWQRKLTAASQVTPSSLSFDASDNLYVAGFTGSSSFLALVPNAGTTITWQITSASDPYALPQWAVTDSSGNTWGTSFNGSSTFNITKIDASGNVVFRNSITNMANNGGLALDATNGYFYVATTNLGSFSGNPLWASFYKLPANGDNTVGSLTNVGPYTPQSYSAGSIPTLSSPSLSNTANSLTDAAGALTDAAGDLTTNNSNVYSNQTATF
jgi:hypothetical protein